MSLQGTTSQTVGPYFKIGLTDLREDNLAKPSVIGKRVKISGQVIDGNGRPVSDAIVELWQANACGKYRHDDDTQDKPIDPAFHGYGRIPTDDGGRFSFTTIKPGPVPGPDGKPQAPHIAVSVFMRGLLIRLVTRIYFPDEPLNDRDCVLNLVERERWRTLIAQKMPNSDNSLSWDVHLQGPKETVFFDF